MGNNRGINQILNGNTTLEVTTASEMKKTGTVTERITEPHENDILMGRGGKNNQHVGNENLRSMAREQSENYRLSSKKGKSYISRELVRRVRLLSPPGRFLKKNTISGDWEDVGDEVAREKASQVLRDAVSASMSSPSHASDAELDRSMEDLSNEHRRSSSAPPVIMGSDKPLRRRREWEEPPPATASPPRRVEYYNRNDNPHHPYHYYATRSSQQQYPPVSPSSDGSSSAKRRRYYHTSQSWHSGMATRPHYEHHPPPPPPPPDVVRSAPYSGRRRVALERPAEAPPLMGDVQSGMDEFDLFNGELLRDSEDEGDDRRPSDLHSDTF